MRTSFAILALLLGFTLRAQQKSIVPLPELTAEAQRAKAGTTRAVVIGISDYQDPQIPDLHFADKDAEAFANFLRSPAGGSLWADKVSVLTNRDATTGKIIAALDGLIVASKPGDEAIIYFSGHGDVERVSKFQRGFLLTYDSPPAVYAAGAFSLQYLQDIVTTLSDAGVQVVVITDACRAGKLAGSAVGGTAATSAALANQYANEVKILSCQPEEFSLEGEQWGGRGCFSYHLVDALFGMADANADGTVNLMELGRYLEDKVTTEAAPHTQIPFTVGKKSAPIASVNADALAQWRQQKNGEAVNFKKIDSKGLEELALAKADTAILKMYKAFNLALEAGNLMVADSAAGKSADDFYKLLIQDPSITELHGLMTRNFAASLMDEGQQVINKFLKTESETVDNIWANPIKYDHVPAHLHRAAELLGEKHYAYKNLKAKEYFFLAKKTRKETYPDWSLDTIYSIKKVLLNRGLSYDSTAAYLYESFFEFVGVDSTTIHYVTKAVELAPNWTLAHYELAGLFSFRDEAKSIEQLTEAIQIDSNFLSSYRQIAWAYELIGKVEDARFAREKYIRKVWEKYQLDSNSVPAYELNSMGNVLWRLKRYREADIVLKKAIKITNGKYLNPFGNLLGSLVDQGKYEEFVEIFEKYCTETHASFYGTVGDVYYYFLKNPERAAMCYQKGLENAGEDNLIISINSFSLAHFHRLSGNLDKALTIMKSSEFPYLWHYLELGDLLLQMGKVTEARPMFDSIALRVTPAYLKDDSGNNYFGGPDYLYQIVALQRLGKTAEMERALAFALAAPNCDGWRHFWLAGTYAQIGQLDSAMQHLELSEKAGWEPNPAYWFFGTTKDIYLDPLRHLPAFQAWERRWMPPYKDYSKD